MRVYLSSVGCRLNQSEMEHLARQLVGAGHRVVNRAEDADVCILNTCAVTREAEKTSRQTARRLLRENPAAEVVLTGCYATLRPDLAAELAGIQRVVENARKEQLLSILLPSAAGSKAAVGALPGSRTRAFVKIQDGCDNQCAYCVTTIARGPGISRPISEIVAEVRALEAAGYKEVVLTGVHIGSYGRGSLDRETFPGRPAHRLAELVQSLLRHTSLARLRLSSLEPWDLTPELIALWRDRRLCRQLHLPLQSGSSTVLRRMGRPCSPAEFANLAAAARAAIPDLALTTDVIAGFPGETETEFEESLAFVAAVEPARLHVFGYSARPGTRAASMPDQVPPAIIKERSRRLRELGAIWQERVLQEFVGREMPVLWESQDAAGIWHGHTDNYLHVTTRSSLALRNTITPTHLLAVHSDTMLGTVGDPA